MVRIRLLTIVATAALSDAVEYAADKDAVAVASAGNSSSHTLFYPAADAGKAHTVSATFRGRLERRNRSRAFSRVVGSGQIAAVLRFTGARRLSLFLLQRNRATVRISGNSPLTLRRQVASGLVTFVVKGAGAKASYRLTLSYAVP